MQACSTSGHMKIRRTMYCLKECLFFLEGDYKDVEKFELASYRWFDSQ